MCPDDEGGGFCAADTDRAHGNKPDTDVVKVHDLGWQSLRVGPLFSPSIEQQASGGDWLRGRTRSYPCESSRGRGRVIGGCR